LTAILKMEFSSCLVVSNRAHKSLKDITAVQKKTMNSFKYFLILIATLYLVPNFAGQVNAREIYAEKTGRECEACHIDPLGGGKLTAVGEGYLIAISPDAAQGSGKHGFVSKIIRLALLYIHIITAFMWFGTILYVHLVLKPAYASMGLPSGEVKVGLVSMAVMAITGAGLTYYKISSLGQLLESNFGILLLGKIIIFSIMVISALYVVFIIGPKLKKKKAVQTPLSDSLTLGELASFDGEEGRAAYIAYKGNIYDVSKSNLWRNGNHMTRHQAGVDLTDVLSQAPHGEDKILSMQEVGKISMLGSKTEVEAPQKIFYFMAYMNLGFVFVISLILALWRW